MNKNSRMPAHFITGTALCAGLILLASGCSRTAAPDVLVQQAQHYHQTGDDKAAMIQLKNALKAAPQNAAARQLLGSIYLAQGDAVSADVELRKALTLGAAKVAVYQDLGRAMLVQGQYQQLLDQTASFSDQSANLLAQRGDAWLGLGDSVKAQAQYERALALQADNVEAMVGMGKRASLDKDWVGAAQYADQAIKAHPSDVSGWLLRADVLRAQGHPVEALAAYDKAAQLQPSNAGIFLAKVNLDINQKNFTQAAAELDRAQKLAPNSAAVKYSRALLQMSNGDLKSARESIQQVLSVAPDNPAALLFAGYVYLQLGALQEAEQNLKLFLENKPRDLFATKMLAATLLKSSQSQRAYDLIEPTLTSYPDDVALLLLAAEAQTQLKNFQKSASLIEHANAVQPNASSIHAAMGLNKLGAGDTTAALAELESAARLGETTTNASAAQISIYMQQRQFDKAAAAAASMAQREPKNAVARVLQGRISLVIGKRAEARQYFDDALRIQPDAMPAVLNLVQMDLDDHQPAAATARLQKVLDADKLNLEATVAMASLELRAGQVAPARQRLLAAVGANPNSFPATKSLVTLYLKTNEPGKALVLAQQFQAAAGTSIERLELLADAQLGAGQIAEALASWQRIATMGPENPSIALRIAALQGRLKNFTEARHAAETALKMEPGNVSAQVMLAGLATQQGQFDEALAMARRLQTQKSEDPVGYTLEGDVYSAKKAPAPAIKAYEKALTHGAGSDIVRRLYAVEVAAGNQAEADRRIGEWLAAHPADIATRLLVGQEAMRSGQNAAAIAQFEAVSVAAPDNAMALNNLAWLYQQKADGRALSYAQRALAAGPTNPAVMDTAGWIMAEQGDTAKALPLLEKATSMQPDAIDVRLHLARALFKSGDKARAKKELERSIAQDRTITARADVAAFQKQF